MEPQRRRSPEKLQVHCVGQWRPRRSGEELEHRPVGPLRWYDAQGHMWQYTRNAGQDPGEMLDQFAADLESRLWITAAGHWMGSLLADGSDLYSARWLMEKWDRQGKNLAAGTLQAVLAGGIWTEERRAKEKAKNDGPLGAGDVSEDGPAVALCPRCRSQPETDLHFQHRRWGCRGRP